MDANDLVLTLPRTYGVMLMGVAAWRAGLLTAGRRLWLRRFRFGPADWVWRSLSYGHRQPMLRGDLLLSHTGMRVVSVCVLLFVVPLVHGGMAHRAVISG